MHAQSRPLIHHRTAEFREIFLRAIEGLKYLYQTEGDIVILTASGTGGLEAAVSNLLTAGDRAIVINAGKFGDRWTKLCQSFGVQVDEIFVERGRAVVVDQVREALSDGPAPAAVFWQDNESSTGVRNPTREIAELIRDIPGTCSVVDAITGLGVHPVETDKWGLDIVVGGSQKALGLTPGLAFVSVSQKAWRRIERAKNARFYFDLQREAKNQRQGQSAFTPGISIFFALLETLEFVRGAGLETWLAHTHTMAEMTRSAARALSLELFAKSPGNALTAVWAPAGLDSTEIVRSFRDEFGIAIANGQDELKGKIFRIGHLGYIDFSDTMGTIAALEVILQRLGQPCVPGTGVRAAQETYLGLQKV